MECLAIFERGVYGNTPAAEIGTNSHCPYCRARIMRPPAAGQVIMLLNGPDAGCEFVVNNKVLPYQPGFHVTARRALRNYERRISETDLYATLPDLRAPTWLAPVSLREGFIIDELAVWFCDRGLVGAGFHWKPIDIIELVYVCWQKRFPVSAAELSLVLISHGMPSDHQASFEQLFEFGTDCLVRTHRRPPLKKLRKPLAIAEVFSDALRYYR